MKNILIFTIVIFSLLSCDNFQFEKDEKSGLTDDSQREILTKVGENWTLGLPTNLTFSSYGNWDSVDIDNPVVVRVGFTYHMWYSGLGSDGVWRIGYAKSLNGVSWVKDITNPILGPTNNALSGDNTGIKLSSVVYDSQVDKFRIWFVGWNGNAGKREYSLFYAESNEPNSGWYKYPNQDPSGNENPKSVYNLNVGDASTISDLLERSVGSSSVIQERKKVDGYDEIVYRYWLTLLDEGKPIVKSGIHFEPIDWDLNTNFTPSLTDFSASDAEDQFFANGYISPAVISDIKGGEDIYKMWFLSYGESPEIGLAYSTVSSYYFSYYNQLEKKSLFGKGSIDQDEEAIYSPHVIRDGMVYKMWYVGKDVNMKKTICYKESK